MSESRYMVVTRNDDGEVFVHFYEKRELEQELNDQCWGPDMRWLSASEVERESDPQAWKGERVGIIVKADAVLQPRAVEKITRVAID